MAASPILDLGKPIARTIVFRYIDPRLVPLLVELGRLSLKVQTIAEAGSSKENEELQDLAKSTKNLSSQMSIILEENDTGVERVGDTNCTPERVESEFT